MRTPPNGPALTYAMIGGGSGAFIGGVHRIAASLDNRAVLVAGALSSTPERALASAKELGLPADRSYSTWEELVQREAARPDPVDFVVIVTPNDTHYPIAKGALGAGFHVVLDKPATHTSAQAEELRDLARAKQRLCCVTYNYTGYPMVRHMREVIASGALGPIRKVFCAYHQGWLATALERTGQKQAAWRLDPARAGLGGALGDIGSHAENLVSFVTQLEPEAVCAELTSFVEGRPLDDDASVLMRFEGGARGVLTASQVCVGEGNNLSLRVYCEKGGLVWRQEAPDELRVSRLDEPTQVVMKGGPGAGEAAGLASRIPQGHPEGYLEAFGNVYRGVVEWISAAKDGREAGPLARAIPTIDDGVRGVRFVEKVVESARAGGAWVAWL